MTKISVIIPHMPSIEGADQALKKCLYSLDATEKIVVVNEGIGYGKACNIGIRQATGEWIFIVNNDTFIKQGSLQDLTSDYDDAIVTVPYVEGQRDSWPRSFYGINRKAYDKLKYPNGNFFDEDFEIGYWEDDDIIERIIAHGVKTLYNAKVKVGHPNPGMTVKTFGEQQLFDKNKEIFDKKWRR